MTTSVLTVEAAETQIRQLVRDGRNDEQTKAKVKKVIEKAVKEMPEALKEQTRQALINLYNKSKRTMALFSPYMLFMVSAIQKTNGETPLQPITKSEAKSTLEDIAKLKGVPMQKYMKDYIKLEVRPILDRLAKQYATIDRHKLTNKAEMQARFDEHTQNRKDLEARGVKLVIISSHADCSERCRAFQGKVFSLDGTSGTTPDGRHYEPLEVATNVIARRKDGSSYGYYNGLFGFNCRHYMVEYKNNFHFPTIPKSVEEKEYAITETQRAYERKIRAYKNEAEVSKGIDKEAYIFARNAAKRLTSEYIAFSEKHNRAYYPDRTKIL